MFYLWGYVRKRINTSLLPFYLFALFFVILPLIVVLVNAFTPTSGQPLSENFAFINGSLWIAIIRSIWVAAATIVIVLAISYPFAYVVSGISNRTFRIICICLVTCPLWGGFFVKLIGLKSFFDLIFGEMNSTRGLIYVIIGLSYLNLPIAIITFYNSFRSIPKNILNASFDLGRTHLETFVRIVVPYTSKAIWSVVFMVFLPSVTCVTVADFMNKSNSSKMVSQIINDLIVSGGKEGIGTNRLSMLTTFLTLFVFILYILFRYSKVLLRRYHVRYS